WVLGCIVNSAELLKIPIQLAEDGDGYKAKSLSTSAFLVSDSITPCHSSTDNYFEFKFPLPSRSPFNCSLFHKSLTVRSLTPPSTSNSHSYPLHPGTPKRTIPALGSKRPASNLRSHPHITHNSKMRFPSSPLLSLLPRPLYLTGALKIL